MSKKAPAAPPPVTEQQQADYAWLVQPAKDLVENFSIDVLAALSGYLEVIEQECEANREAERDRENNPGAIFKLFNFGRACRVLQGSIAVYSKKVDHIHDLTYSVLELIENRNHDDGEGGGGNGRGRRGARRNVNLGSTDFGLIDIKELKKEALQNYEKAEKEEKKAIDKLRSVDLAESRELQYERNHCLIEKPTQFMFKVSYGQMNRTDEQIYSAKSRPELIGKVKDFDVKKAEMIHEHQILYTHDCYKENIDEFTLPGARWIPDNKELATNFGCPDVEVELDLEKKLEQVNALGPYKDPLSGRDVVAPPRWFVEQEAVRQHQEILSRATSRAGMARDSQGIPLSQRISQGVIPLSQRMSQPMMEKRRNKLSELVSFVDGRMKKDRPSTRLTTGLVDRIVETYGQNGVEPFEDQGGQPDDMDYGQQNYSYNEGGGQNYDMGGGEQDENEDPDDYVGNLTRQNRRQRTGPAPWDDLEPARIPMYTGDEEIPTTRRPVKPVTKEAPRPHETLRRKRLREAKNTVTRRDQFMETHDYLQDYYYWRSAARINPDKDWKVEALRTSILAEKKRRVKERIAKIREIRMANQDEKRAGRRRGRGIPVEEYEMCMEEAMQIANGNFMDMDYGGGEQDYDNGGGGTGEEGGEPVVPEQNDNRRTMGAEYDHLVDDDLAEDVEIAELHQGYDNYDDGGGGPDYDYDPAPDPMGDVPVVPPSQGTEGEGGERPTTAQNHRPMRFGDIDEAELNNVINLPGNLFIDKALPLLRDFADNQTDRDELAYKMAKAYENVDVAVSTLQETVDKWHAKLEPILEEGETRKEYDVHVSTQEVLKKFEKEGETKDFLNMCIGTPWYEISRNFLACLFMCNVGNVAISEDDTLDLDKKINSMKVTLLNREMHREKIREMDGLGQLGAKAAEKEAEKQ